MGMICKNTTAKIFIESNRSEREAVETRSISFPNGETYLLPMKNRIWSWYDEFLNRYPWKIHWFKLNILKCAVEGVKLEDGNLDKHLKESFGYVLAGINRVELKRGKNFLIERK